MEAEDPEVAPMIQRCVMQKKTLIATFTYDALSLADVDAVWFLTDPAAPGDNFMAFDNFQIALEPSPPEFAPNFVNFHLEHHLAAAVPCYRLRDFHALLQERQVYDHTSFPASYSAVLRSVTTPA